uniref:Ribosomal protein S4 n=2 Tax=Roya TaxID=43942 RepID=A0A6G9IG03_9VIRI|nr:ribosomal protein S4 [Roya obtusa]YP_009755724.1 ribosomal protein S4 [Roya anglica]AGZ90394.1 ribosomal protein S4 [Roya obtusa]QIQ22963.1 ribosomal protein S4 [Roya anglica]
MKSPKFKVSRLISNNIWQTKRLTFKQTSLLSKLKKKSLKKQSDFSISLRNMKKLSLFYGNLPIKKMKRNVTYSYLDKKKSLLYNLETRLDVVLTRINFCSTIYTARQLISHKKIYVNFQQVLNPSFLLQNGDIVSVSPTFVNLLKLTIQENFKKKRIFFEKAVHIEVNYKIFTAVMLYEPAQIFFPYKINFSLLF